MTVRSHFNKESDIVNIILPDVELYPYILRHHHHPALADVTNLFTAWGC